MKGTIRRVSEPAPISIISALGAQGIDEREKLPARGVEARAARAFGLHAGGEIHDHDGVAGRGAEMDERWIGQSGDQRDRGEQLQNQEQVLAQQPAQPRRERALLQHPFPDEERRRA